ncbi:MAG: DNA-binding protein [Clostridia bacterium]|nr:DNA-binding protein [Clostridia bacterium]
MFEKNLKIGYLLDFYGDTLDEHTREVMKAYYDDDLSLAEIAEGVGISRQGVRHLIKKGEEHLTFLESRLGLAAHSSELKRVAAQLEALREELAGHGDSSLSEGVRILDEAVNVLNSKN